ncbi:hypothetical protein V1478_010328 [Vespula squamosa]|uniref:Uncharacterized protein n=1 Tax=Vespula squamosa TaxID=30214 RepID=A0ABD2AHH3_VESSQ
MPYGRTFRAHLFDSNAFSYCKYHYAPIGTSTWDTELIIRYSNDNKKSNRNENKSQLFISVGPVTHCQQLDRRKTIG